MEQLSAVGPSGGNNPSERSGKCGDLFYIQWCMSNSRIADHPTQVSSKNGQQSADLELLRLQQKALEEMKKSNQSAQRELREKSDRHRDRDDGDRRDRDLGRSRWE